MSSTAAQWVQIQYKKLKNINFSLCNVRQDGWHFHSCVELGVVLSGQVQVTAGKDTYVAAAGSLMLFNAYEAHNLVPMPQAEILYLQVAPGFGKEYFSQVANLEFDTNMAAVRLSCEKGCSSRIGRIPTTDRLLRRKFTMMQRVYALSKVLFINKVWRYDKCTDFVSGRLFDRYGELCFPI